MFPNFTESAKYIDVNSDITAIKGEITSRRIDYDGEEEYDTDYETEKGENNVIIGIILAKCNVKYSGVLKIPEVDIESKTKMIEFLDK